MQSASQFNIKDYTGQLTPSPKKGYYVCPNCNEPQLSIAKGSSKYNCYHCGDTKAIARILTAPEREQRQRDKQRQFESKTNFDRSQEWIKGSAVAAEITEANLKHIEEKKAIALLLGWKSYCYSSGWYIKSCDPITGKRSEHGQFKPDTGIQFHDSDETQKYVSFPKGKGIEAIYLVLTLAYWQKISDRYGIPIAESDIDKSRDDLGFWQWVLKNPEIPIIITEGAKKAGCLLSYGFVAIALTGVSCGQKQGKNLLPSLANFIVPGRPLFLAFDADITQKEQVRQALIKLVQLIKHQDKYSVVRLIRWSLEQGKGCDDLIVNHGIEAFEAAYEDATSYGQWIKEIKFNNNAYRQATGGGNGNGNNGSGNGNGGNGGNGGRGDGNGGRGDGNGGERSKKNREQRYETTCRALGLPFENCVTAQTFDGFVYRRVFQAGAGDWKTIDTAFYSYTGRGYWQNEPDKLIHKLIADVGEEAFKLKYSKDEGWIISYPYENNNNADSAFKYCRKRLEPVEPLPANGHLRAFRNCTVDMRTGQTMPHDPMHYLTSGIPYDYYRNRPCPEVFYQFLCDAYGEDLIPVIRAFTSMFLDPTAPYGKFPHLIGQSGSGKGTLGRLWNSLYGENGSGSGIFSDIATPEGRHQYLTGKSIFAIPDVGGYITGLRAFYELVDNGELTGRALFNPTGYQKRFNVRFWVASVDHLQIENAGDGWDRRAYPIPTQGKPLIVDPNLGLKIEAVKADIISWALAMPKEERDRILLTPATNERIINLKYDAALYGDSVKSFVDLCLRPTTESKFVPNDLLHSWYVEYCKVHGYTPMGMSKFVSHLRTILPQNHVQRRWGAMQNGGRKMLPAHWQNLTGLNGVFVAISGDSNTYNSYSSSTPTDNHDPIWKCIKSKCVEGGLLEFEDFWNPPPPDSDDGGNQPPPNQPTPPPPLKVDQGGSGYEQNLSSTLIHSQTTINQGFDQVDQGGSGGSGLVLSYENLNAVVQNFSENVEPPSNPLIHPDPLPDPLAVTTSNQGVQGSQSIQLPELSPTFKVIQQQMMLVETLADLEAVKRMAEEKGLPDNWKKTVWPYLDKNTQARIKCLKQEKLSQTASTEALAATAIDSIAEVQAIQENDPPPFPNVGDLVWRKPNGNYSDGQICCITKIASTGAYTDNNWHISHYAWSKGNYVPYPVDTNSGEQ